MAGNSDRRCQQILYHRVPKIDIYCITLSNLPFAERIAYYLHNLRDAWIIYEANYIQTEPLQYDPVLRPVLLQYDRLIGTTLKKLFQITFDGFSNDDLLSIVNPFQKIRRIGCCWSTYHHTSPYLAACRRLFNWGVSFRPTLFAV